MKNFIFTSIMLVVAIANSMAQDVIYVLSHIYCDEVYGQTGYQDGKGLRQVNYSNLV